MHPAAPKRGAKALVSAYIVARCFLNALRLSSKWPRQRHARFALDPPGNPSSSRASWTRIYVGVAAPRTSNVSSYSWKPKGNLARRRTWESHLSFRQLPLLPPQPIISRVKSSRPFPREEESGEEAMNSYYDAQLWRTFVFFSSRSTQITIRVQNYRKW